MASRGRPNGPVSTVALSNMWVVVMATLVTAVASLVAEDLLPNSNPWLRPAVLAGLLGLLFWALLSRTAAQRTTGTLFHVQVLDESMRDLRAAGRREAERNRMAIRSVTRWVDLHHRADPATGVVDVVDLTRDVADVLEEQINTDLADTGYTVAPVLPWPIALAVGTQLPLGERLQLLELRDGAGNPTNRIALAGPPRQITVRPLPATDVPGDGNVGVWLALTSASKHFDERAFAAYGVTSGKRISLWPELPSDPSLTDDDVTGLGAAIAEQLVTVRGKMTDDQELIIVAMITKVVAMATGWHLAQHGCRFFDRTHLLWYDAEQRRLVPMRVKESQPMHAPGTRRA